MTELYFRYRTRVRAGQVRGLDKSTLREFCQRWYEERGNGIIKLETKSDMKARTRQSPDLADNAVIAEELFRRRGLLKGGKRSKKKSSWSNLASKLNSVYSDEFAYAQEDVDGAVA